MKKTIIRFVLVLIISLSFSLVIYSVSFAERKRLEKPVIKFAPVKPETKEELWKGVHPKTGKNLYEHNPQSKVEFNSQKQEYIYTWNSCIQPGKRIKAVWEPPIKVDVIVRGEVRFSPSIEKYIYDYKVANLKTSKQKVQRFAIEYKILPKRLIETYKPLKNEEDYKRQFREYDKIWKNGLNEIERNVTVKRPDENWRLSFCSPILYFYYETFVWRWVDVKEHRRGILPGSSQEGFVLEDSNLPGIIQCFAKGYTPALTVPEEGTSRKISDHYSEITKYYGKGVSGKTIGPVPPPERFVAKTFLDQVLSYVKESEEQGWIETNRTANNIEESLNKIGKYLTSHKFSQAKEEIKSLLKEIETLKERELITEAYGLLMYNLEYLLKQISES